MYLQKVIKGKNIAKNLVFCWHLEGPDPRQNVMDPEHCEKQLRETNATFIAQ